MHLRRVNSSLRSIDTVELDRFRTLGRVDLDVSPRIMPCAPASVPRLVLTWIFFL